MGGATAVVERRGGHLRAVLSRRGAVAGRQRAPAAPEGDGAGDDLLLPAQLLLLRRRLRPLVDRLDLEQHRPPHPPPPEPARPEDLRRSPRRMGSPPRPPARPPAPAGASRPERGRALLLRMDEPSARGPLVGVVRAPRALRENRRRRAQPLRLVRRGLRPRRRPDQLFGARGGAPPPARAAGEARDRPVVARRRRNRQHRRRPPPVRPAGDRKSTRLNSSHSSISYAPFFF